jgi:hypothetical protein
MKEPANEPDVFIKIRGRKTRGRIRIARVAQMRIALVVNIKNRPLTPHLSALYAPSLRNYIVSSVRTR